MLDQLTAFVTGNIETFGYAAVFLLMALESANIPIPSEIIMPFAGFLAAQGKLNFHGAAFAGGAGCLAGSLASYGIGFKYGRPFILAHGKRFLIGPKQVVQGDWLFSKYGSSVSFFSRLLPVVRTFISLVAGIWRVPLKPFITLTFIGSWIWSYVLAYVGLVMGQNWEMLRPLWHKFDAAIIGAGVVCVSIYVWHHWKSAQPEKAKSEW